MNNNKEKPISFAAFKLVTNLNALAIFSIVPIIILLPIYGLAVGVTFGTGVGGCLLLTAMTDEEFRIGYDEGTAEEYEDYLESEDG